MYWRFFGRGPFWWFVFHITPLGNRIIGGVSKKTCKHVQASDRAAMLTALGALACNVGVMISGLITWLIFESFLFETEFEESFCLQGFGLHQSPIEWIHQPLGENACSNRCFIWHQQIAQQLQTTTFFVVEIEMNLMYVYIYNLASILRSAVSRWHCKSTCATHTWGQLRVRKEGKVGCQVVFRWHSKVQLKITSWSWKGYLSSQMKNTCGLFNRKHDYTKQKSNTAVHHVGRWRSHSKNIQLPMVPRHSEAMIGMALCWQLKIRTSEMATPVIEIESLAKN